MQFVTIYHLEKVGKNKVFSDTGDERGSGKQENETSRRCILAVIC